MCCSSKNLWLIALALGLVTALSGGASADEPVRDTTSGTPKIISVSGGDTMRVVEISIDNGKLQLEGADAQHVTMRLEDLPESGSLRSLIDKGNVVISEEGDSIHIHVGGVEKARYKTKSVVDRKSVV